ALAVAAAAACGLVGAAVLDGREATARAADTSCTTSGPSTGAYEVTMCLTAPGAGATASGDVPAAATVATTYGASIQRVVAAVGDGAGGESSEEAVVGEIASWNPSLLLYLGDVYQKGSPAEFDNWYGRGDPRFYGRFRSITNPAVGNHEYDGSQAAGYFD